MNDLLEEGLATAERQIRAKTGITGVATGFPELDRMLLGLHNHELTLLVGHPSTGKTAFMLNLLKHIAVEGNKGVLLFSPAMSKQEVMRRFLCFLGGVDLLALRSGQLDGLENYAPLTIAASKISKATIYVDDTPTICTLELTKRALIYHAKWNIRLVVIDSLDCITSNGRPDNRYLEWLKILRCLKLFTMDCRVPVLALTSLSRFPKHQRWLAWRSIEQTADVVMKMQPIRQGSFRDHQVRLSVVQQRNGPTGNMDMKFHAALQQFTAEK